MAAQEKIEHSEYNLARLKKGGMESNFHFDLSNFLSSTQSIFWHMMYDYADEFSLLKPKNLNSKKFKELAKGNEEIPENKKALNFINWYETEIKKISKEGFEFIIERRHMDIHEGAFPGVLKVTKTTSDDSSVDTDIGYSVKTPGRHYSIPEIPYGEEPVQFCEKYLEKIKKMVYDAERKFKSL